MTNQTKMLPLLSTRIAALQRTIRLLGGALLLAGVPALATAAAPTLAGAPRDGWVAYRVPIVVGRSAPCCFDFEHRSSDRICDLDGDHGFSTSDRDPPSKPGDALAVYVRFADGRIDHLRALGAACPTRSDTPVATLAGIDAAASLAMLRNIVGDGSGRKHEDLASDAVAAIAFHADPGAIPLLAELSAPTYHEDTRQNAVFWLGQNGGKAGADAIERIARNDDDAIDIRRHALFSLSQSDAIDAYPMLAGFARDDNESEMRSQALFWMANGSDKRAKADILAAIHGDRDEDVVEQGVFALSQLKPGGEEALIELVRGNVPREVKKKALFWLAQSDSDAAVRLLDEVLADAAR